MRRKIKIGLLGGSFNPAHDGHLYISEIARKKLGLKQVWWLVSPQNPLKPAKGMDKFDNRFASAEKVTGNNPFIKILDIESRIGTVYTADTLKKLNKMFPGYEFYWLMGADNLMQIPLWQNWQEIFKLAHVHVFDRGHMAHRAMRGVAATRFPVNYHHIRNNPFSSTKLRSSAPAV